MWLSSAAINIGMLPICEKMVKSIEKKINNDICSNEPWVARYKCIAMFWPYNRLLMQNKNSFEQTYLINRWMDTAGRDAKRKQQNYAKIYAMESRRLPAQNYSSARAHYYYYYYYICIWLGDWATCSTHSRANTRTERSSVHHHQPDLGSFVVLSWMMNH